MEDNKEKKIEEVNSQVNEANEENLTTSNDEKVTIEVESVVENTVAADEKSLQEESKIESTISALEEKVDDSKKLTIKEDSKVLFVMGVILVIIGTVLEIGMYVYENISKNDEQKDVVKEEVKEEENPSSNEEIIRQIGLDAEEYLEINADKFVTVDELTEYLLDIYSFECEELIINENNSVFFNNCSVNGSEYLYSYGQFVELEVEFLNNDPNIYKDYKELKIVDKKVYETAINEVEYNNIIKNFTLITKDDKEQVVKNVSVELEDGFVYINILDNKVKVLGVEDAIKVVAVEPKHPCLEYEFSIFVLTVDNSVYIYNSVNDFSDKEYSSKEELINTVENMQFQKKRLSNKYQNITLGEYSMRFGCGDTEFLLGKSEYGENYVIDLVEGKIIERSLKEQYPYSYFSLPSFNYYIDLEGNVKNDSNDEYNYKANYVFVEEKGNDKLASYILDKENMLHMFYYSHETNYALENKLVLNSIVTNIYYKDDNYILVFENNKILKINNAYLDFGEI